MGFLIRVKNHLGHFAPYMGFRGKRPGVWLSVFMVLAASAALFYWLWHGTTLKEITLVVDGEEMKIETHHSTLEQVLKEKGIVLSPHDKTDKPLEASLFHGDRVVIQRAIPIQLTDGGKTSTVFAVGQTVKELLADLQIPLGKLDRVTPSPDAPVKANDSVQIVRVEKKIVEKKEPIPYRIVRKNDPNLLKGKEKVLQEGKEGIIAQKIEKIYENNKLVAEKEISRTVMEESVDKIVAVGTKVPVTVLSASSPDISTVTKGGVTFGVKKILENVTITAYSAGVESTGKTKDHPQYGITYTGTKATEGRTVAVDPNVIPLGWWIYIEGFGFRRAEDIGSGVKGNWVDIYFDSDAYANRFGTKKGHKVYVIGPNKPSSE